MTIKAGADIPDMGEKFCKIAAESGVNGLILFSTGRPQRGYFLLSGQQSKIILPH